MNQFVFFCKKSSYSLNYHRSNKFLRLSSSVYGERTNNITNPIIISNLGREGWGRWRVGGGWAGMRGLSGVGGCCAATSSCHSLVTFCNVGAFCEKKIVQKLVKTPFWDIENTIIYQLAYSCFSQPYLCMVALMWQACVCLSSVRNVLWLNGAT